MIILDFIMQYKIYIVIYFVIGFLDMLFHYGLTVRAMTKNPYAYRGYKISWIKLFFKRFLFWPLTYLLELVVGIAMIGVKR